MAPLKQKLLIGAQTHRVVTASIHNPAHAVNEPIATHPTVHKADELGSVVPSAFVVSLNTLHPIKHYHDTTSR